VEAGAPLNEFDHDESQPQFSRRHPLLRNPLRITVQSHPCNMQISITYHVFDIYVSEKNEIFYNKIVLNTMNYIPTERKLITVFNYQNQKIKKKYYKTKMLFKLNEQNTSEFSVLET
jgi:hypothetical protein